VLDAIQTATIGRGFGWRRVLDNCGQATKGAWGMSWRQKTMTGVEDCEKSGVVVKQTLIPAELNALIRRVERPEGEWGFGEAETADLEPEQRVYGVDFAQSRHRTGVERGSRKRTGLRSRSAGCRRSRLGTLTSQWWPGNRQSLRESEKPLRGVGPGQDKPCWCSS
jgi:hypothetical protein